MPIHPRHPGPLGKLRPVKIGPYYVQQALEYLAGQGFTEVPVRGCWQVWTLADNELVTETDNRLLAISEAHTLNGSKGNV